MIEDINLKDDPYYLKYYRGFHNHELDIELVKEIKPTVGDHAQTALQYIVSSFDKDYQDEDLGKKQAYSLIAPGETTRIVEPSFQPPMIMTELPDSEDEGDEAKDPSELIEKGTQEAHSHYAMVLQKLLHKFKRSEQPSCFKQWREHTFRKRTMNDSSKKDEVSENFKRTFKMPL